jgi:RimJ/RimL family protein N-acetyltransferase
MTTAATALPLLGLRVCAGPVELRGITDDLLTPLADLATDIHDADFMPFTYPWSLTPAAGLARSVAQYHWGKRASFSAAQWNADLAVFYDGELVGSQGFSTRDYLITRGGQTGSWLSRRFQGRGIGTAMRQVICAFLFDHVDAAYITSAAFADNPASLAVSRKTGYTDNGAEQVNRLGESATLRRILLEPAGLVRYEHPLTVTGLTEFRASIGLDADAVSSASAGAGAQAIAASRATHPAALHPAAPPAADAART